MNNPVKEVVEQLRERGPLHWREFCQTSFGYGRLIDAIMLMLSDTRLSVARDHRLVLNDSLCNFNEHEECNRDEVLLHGTCCPSCGGRVELVLRSVHRNP